MTRCVCEETCRGTLDSKFVQLALSTLSMAFVIALLWLFFAVANARQRLETENNVGQYGQNILYEHPIIT